MSLVPLTIAFSFPLMGWCIMWRLDRLPRSLAVRTVSLGLVGGATVLVLRKAREWVEHEREGTGLGEVLGGGEGSRIRSSCDP